MTAALAILSVVCSTLGMLASYMKQSMNMSLSLLLSKCVLYVCVYMYTHVRTQTYMFMCTE